MSIFIRTVALVGTPSIVSVVPPSNDEPKILTGVATPAGPALGTIAVTLRIAGNPGVGPNSAGL